MVHKIHKNKLILSSFMGYCIHKTLKKTLFNFHHTLEQRQIKTFFH